MVAAGEATECLGRLSAPSYEFDQGQLNALQTFAFGLQTIQDRRDLDDDMLREQVGRFLRNRRQALGKR